MCELRDNEIRISKHPQSITGVLSGCKNTIAQSGNKVMQLIEVLNTSDYYLSHRANRPKFEIAHYISSHNFSVPHRFSDIEEALKKPIKDYPIFILRSEHPQDYDGRSGDLPSWEIHRKNDNTFEIFFEGLRKYIPGNGINNIIQSYNKELRRNRFALESLGFFSKKSFNPLVPSQWTPAIAGVSRFAPRHRSTPAIQNTFLQKGLHSQPFFVKYFGSAGVH